MITDQATIILKAGKGGRGSNATISSKRRGANGGKGGDVYVMGDDQIDDLYKYKLTDHYEAGTGANAERGCRDGLDGTDIVIHLPIVTVIEFENGKEVVVNTNGDKFKIIDGGRGGIGSIIAPGDDRRYDPDAKGIDLGKFGKEETLKLTFQLVADVIFMGFPNAGKSSMLNELSNSKVKVAPYAFTTLDPQIGVMDEIKLMDLPGLIEGTSEGKGLGMKFVKHTVYSKLIAHFVSLENEDPLATYKALKAEIKKISPLFTEKPEIIILTKSDEATPEKIKSALKQFKKYLPNVVVCSIIDDDSISKLKQLIISRLQEIS